MNDPIFKGLAEGLKPRADTIPVNTLALININATLGRLEKLQERAAQAADRQASALETMVALFASVIGAGTATCYDDGRITNPAVFFLRTGNGAKAFACDENNLDSEDD
jgi:transglutaminase-like putative cysteine protease